MLVKVTRRFDHSDPMILKMSLSEFLFEKLSKNKNETNALLAQLAELLVEKQLINLDDICDPREVVADE